MVSWLPANVKFGSQFWLGQRHCQPPFENKQPIAGWANGTVSHQGILNSQSVDELNICAAIKKNIQIIKNSCQPWICITSIWEWITHTATKLKYANNKQLNWVSGQPPFETFSNLQWNRLWKAQPNQNLPTATAGLKEKCYHSDQKISQPISSQNFRLPAEKYFFYPCL